MIKIISDLDYNEVLKRYNAMRFHIEYDESSDIVNMGRKVKNISFHTLYPKGTTHNIYCIKHKDEMEILIAAIDKLIFGPIDMLSIHIFTILFAIVSLEANIHDFEKIYSNEAQQIIEEFAEIQSVLISENPYSDENISKVKHYFQRYGFEHTDQEIHDRLFMLANFEISYYDEANSTLSYAYSHIITPTYFTGYI